MRTFSDKIHTIELFHGPTLSFKDFGARLLAQYLSYLKAPSDIFVATTGDTGSAVGEAFVGMKGCRVFILYPKGGVTPLQEQQLTTIGKNIQAIEVDGSFEVCQALVKQACLDPALCATTGNSINVMRLFAQSLYYFYAYLQLDTKKKVVFSVPCGNFGHLVSGIFAQKMGLPISHFLAPTNINDEVAQFLQSGIFEPHEAFHTLAPSMDVGNPSNFPRLLT